MLSANTDLFVFMFSGQKNIFFHLHIEVIPILCFFFFFGKSNMLFFCSVDSIMLVEEGFNMVSVDASDKMLKYALKSRWERRKEPAFDQWGTAVFVLLSLN